MSTDLVIPREVPRQIALVSQARRALAEARSLDEVKDIRDKAEAMRLYLRQKDECLEAQNAAAEIKLWAERRAGQLLKDMKEKGERAPQGGDRKAKSNDVILKLPDLGVSLNESSSWQAIADLPEEEFTEQIEEAKSQGKEVTTAAVVKKAKERKRKQGRERKRSAIKEKAAAVAADPSAVSRWEVRCGDCLNLLRFVEPGSVRLAFADPPYNIGIDYGTGPAADSLPDQDFLDWTRRWIGATAATLTPDGSLWVLINDEWADHFGIMLREAGLHRRNWIKWYETFGVNHAGRFNRTSRHLFYCVKDPRQGRFVFNPDAVNRPSARQAKYNDSRADPDGKVWDDVWGIDPPIPRLVGNSAERIPDFPTQLPLALLLPIVGCASEPGDLILDPFAGSGTAGAAALKLGRRFVGIEKSARFAELAGMRLKVAEKEGVA